MLAGSSQVGDGRGARMRRRTCPCERVKRLRRASRDARSGVKNQGSRFKQIYALREVAKRRNVKVAGWFAAMEAKSFAKIVERHVRKALNAEEERGESQQGVVKHWLTHMLCHILTPVVRCFAHM